MAYHHALEWCSAAHGEWLSDAVRLFFSIVNPDFDPAGGSDRAEWLGRLFNEWLLFDHRPDGEGGACPLEIWAALPSAHSGLNPQDRADVLEAVRNQHISTFWIVGASATTHLVHLEDANTGERYDVFDVSASGQLDGTDSGMLSARLVRIRGVWYMAGNPVSEFPIRPTERMRRAIREGYDGRLVRFLDLIRQAYGRHDDGDDGDGIVLGSKFATMASKPQERRYRHSREEWQRLLSRRRELKQRYERYRSEYGLTPNWWDICDAIHGDDGTPPLDVFNGLFADNDGRLPFEDDDETYQAFFSWFVDCWNLLPHRRLDGRCPNEAFASAQRIRAYRHDTSHPRPWLDRLDLMADPESWGAAYEVMQFIDPDEVLGIDRKELERFARQWAKSDDPTQAAEREEFLNDLPHLYFEEDLLHAMLISRLSSQLSVDEICRLLDAFLPHVRERKTCDAISVPVLRVEPRIAWPYLRRWAAHDAMTEPYTLRFVALALARHFLVDSAFAPEQATLVAGLTVPADSSPIEPQNDILLAKESYFGALLIERFDDAMAVFDSGMVPLPVQKAALSKGIRSKRVPAARRAAMQARLAALRCQE